jgi:hypothetical protein
MNVLYVNRGTLRPGLIISLPMDGVCEVVKVNDCRAVCRPFRRVTRTVTPLGGAAKTFSAPADCFGISPQSSVEVLAPSRERFEESTKLSALRAERDELQRQVKALS